MTTSQIMKMKTELWSYEDEAVGDSDEDSDTLCDLTKDGTDLECSLILYNLLNCRGNF